jgi:acyl-coenzyme A thioesterase PaaI-like protein
MGGDVHPLAPVRDGPDADGFYGWTFPGEGFNAYLGRMLARSEGDAVVRVRIPTGPSRSNVQHSVHGGFLLGFLDQAIFVGPVSMGRLPFAGAVTLGVSTQFIGPGKLDQPLDCLVEIVRETGRLMFLRGQMEQGDHVVLTYQATLSKRPKSAA